MTRNYVTGHILNTAHGGRPTTGKSGGVAWVTLVTSVYVLSYLVFERAGWGSPHLRDVVSNVAFVPLNLAALALNALASQHETLHPRVRRALRLLALSSLMVLIGNAISTTYQLLFNQAPTVTWADLFYLSDYGITLAALLTFPRARRPHHERWQFALDAAMVLVGSLVAIWYFVVRPGAETQATGFAIAAWTFAYPLAGMLLLFGITTVLLRGPTDGNRQAFGLLIGGVTLSIIADLTFGLELLDMGRRGVAWTDAVYLVVYLLLIASAETYFRWPVPRRPSPEREPAPAPVSPLPYMAVSLTYLLLLGEALQGWVSPLSTLAVGAVGITILVVSRQFLAVRQNVRLQTETAARRTEARFRSLVQHASDVIWVVSPDRRVRFVSPSVTRVFGYDPNQVLWRDFLELIHPSDREVAGEFLQDAAKAPGVTPPIEWRVRHPDGSWLHTESIGTNLLDDPTVGGIVVNCRDVSERKRLEQQLTHQAFHDSLTGLANRALFRDRVDHALTLARRQMRSLAVLFLDLDDFKKVNDSLGHALGDQVLIQASARFKSCARIADTVARLGGDEFAMLIENVGGSEGHNQVLERLGTAMTQPILLDGNEIVLRASIGIATSDDVETADELLRNADMAMYAAKRQGKGRHARYDVKLHTEAVSALETEAALRGAILRGEMVLHYQPIVSLATGAMFGVEALLRWDHPKQGLLLPAHFVPLAEENGLIVPLGRWVLHEAFGQIRAWREAYPDSDLALSVNISGRQLQVPDIGTEVRAALAATGAEPGAVVLEITESVLMHQAESTLEELQGLKAQGLRLAIDDFGTGYSSLSYLQRFPIDLLKIAKPFVDHVGAGVEQSAVARAIIGLGETLRLRTVAEGIEIEEQRAGLVELGCELGQGYYFAPPMPLAGIGAILAGSAGLPLGMIRRPDAPVIAKAS